MPDSSDKIAKLIVSGMSVVGLVIVAVYDLGSEENVQPFVYGIFGGGVLGAETVAGWFKK